MARRIADNVLIMFSLLHESMLTAAPANNPFVPLLLWHALDYDFGGQLPERSMRYRQTVESTKQRPVLLKAPGLVIAAIAVGAAGGMTASDLFATWSGFGGIGKSCNIKGNISIDTGERIFHVPGQKYYSQTRISPQHGERWFCSETEAWAAGWRKAHR